MQRLSDILRRGTLVMVSNTKFIIVFTRMFPPPTLYLTSVSLVSVSSKYYTQKINFSQRNLGSADAHLIRSAILSNPQLAVLKLGYNNLGNLGANLIAEALGSPLGEPS